MSGFSTAVTILVGEGAHDAGESSVCRQATPPPL